MNITLEGAMPRDLKIENRKIILDFMKDGQPHTVTEMSAALKISRQTIKKKLDFFAEKGIVISCGKGTSSDYGGKRPEIYAINNQIYFLCAFQIFNTRVCIGLFDFSGNCLDQCITFHEESYSVDDYIDIMVDGVETLIVRNEIPASQIHELLVGTNGLVDPKEGVTIKTVVNPHWGSNIPLKKLLEDRIGHICKVRVVNLIALVSAYALADPQMAAARTLVLYWGYGVSMRMIDKGKFRFGDSPICGEIENMVIDFSSYRGPYRERHATLRHLISEKKIWSMFEQLPKEQQEAILAFKREEEIEDDIRLAILQAADAGNAEAQKLVEYMADVFFAALINIMVCYDPKYIVFSGLPRQYHKHFEQRIYANFQEFLYFQDAAQRIHFVFQNEDLLKICLVGSHCLMQKDFLAYNDLYEDK